MDAGFHQRSFRTLPGSARAGTDRDVRRRRRIRASDAPKHFLTELFSPCDDSRISRKLIPDIGVVDAVGVRWFVLKSLPGRELAAAFLLQTRPTACTPYLPTYADRRRIRDGKNNKHGRIVETRKPMFPGYVFARFNYEQRTDILSTPGLQRAGLLTFCGEPAIVTDEQIEEIKTIEAHGVVPSPFREGQPIEIVMDNGLRLTGKLVRDDGETFVVVEYKMLGKAFRMSRDRALVKAA